MEKKIHLSLLIHAITRSSTRARAALAVAALAPALLISAQLKAQTSPASTGQMTRSPSSITTSPVSPTSQRTGTPQTSASTYQSQNNSNAAPATGSNGNASSPMLATDPAYRLVCGDEITIDVHNEPDMSAAQRVDQQGNIRLPLLNDVNVSSKTIREAEAYLEKLYIDHQFLKKPLVTINVRDYFNRQVSVIGAVNAPGIFHFPRETDSIEIVELITSLGGFRPTAKTDNVRVTRTDISGKENTYYVDVDAMIYNKRNAPKTFKVYPGDRILVTERLW